MLPRGAFACAFGVYFIGTLVSHIRPLISLITVYFHFITLDGLLSHKSSVTQTLLHWTDKHGKFPFVALTLDPLFAHRLFIALSCLHFHCSGRDLWRKADEQALKGLGHSA